VHAGFTRFIAIALLLRKFPGGTPCGLCRDVLRHFDADTDVLNICDRDGNVRLFKVKELLPAPQGEVIAYKNMEPAFRVLVNNAVASSLRSYVPYSNQHRGAVMLASRSDGHRRSFRGMNIDNASYGGSSCAEQSAAFAARIAGYTQNPLLIVAGSDPITGESLQVLREFGLGFRIGVVQPDKSLIMTRVDQLFPDSFGPDALA
jgi:cytidine deaminase